MKVYRLSRRKFSKPLSGTGAALKGGRWNSPGVEAIYTASNRSLAMAEVAVHLTLATLPEDYVMTTIEIPDGTLIFSVSEKDCPRNWNAFPYIRETQQIGDQFFAEKRYSVLKVPSAVTQGDHNLLINPHHEEFARVRIIKIEPFPFDSRIFRTR
jgi:RES domain-containing protein